MLQHSPSTTLMARGLEQGDSCEPLDPPPLNTSVPCEGLSGPRRSIEWLDDNTDRRPKWTHRCQGVQPLQRCPYHATRMHSTERGKQAARAYAFVDTGAVRGGVKFQVDDTDVVKGMVMALGCGPVRVAQERQEVGLVKTAWLPVSNILQNKHLLGRLVEVRWSQCSENAHRHPLQRKNYGEQARQN